MELFEYIRLFRKWLWLLFLAAVIAGGISFVTSVRNSPPALYQASVTIAIGSLTENPNPDYSDVTTPTFLAPTYAVLATTHDVMQATVDELNLPLPAEALQGMTRADIIPDTSLLVLSVIFTDPALAVDLVNEVAQQLILHSPTNLSPEQQQRVDLSDRQISILDDEIAALLTELDQIDQQLEAAQSDAEATLLIDQQRVLRNQLTQASATIAQFTFTVTSMERGTGSLRIVEQARLSYPISNRSSSATRSAILGAIVGVALASGVVLLIEYLNESIKTSEEASQILSVPILAAISRYGKASDSYSERLITHRRGSTVAEAFRTLRTNLLFSTRNDNIDGFIITSPGPQEGKSITTSNLAISMAQAGLRVLLIDADLRRPKIHTIFDLPNEVGLTTLLSKTPPSVDNLDDSNMAQWVADCLQDPMIPNLQILTSGFVPNNPAELLGSAAMEHWLIVLQEILTLDIVVVDTPPCLVVSDSTILSATTEMKVVLLLEAGRTKRAAAAKSKELFTQVGGDIAGVILNKANPRDEDYYGYGYYTYYQQSPGESKGAST